MNKKSCGFTLIELLVVVLIIGILAAVALPQYEKAVIKARMSTMKPILKALKDAEEAYYLENGTYTDDFSNLSVQIPCKVLAGDVSQAVCGDDWRVDLLATSLADLTAASSIVNAYYCPGYANNGNCNKNRILYLVYWLEHSYYPSQLKCSTSTSLGLKICNTEQF